MNPLIVKIGFRRMLVDKTYTLLSQVFDEKTQIFYKRMTIKNWLSWKWALLLYHLYIFNRNDTKIELRVVSECH